MTANRVIVIGGPTASGKSALALALAEEFGGRVINANSMQVYREACVVTARPGADEIARAPHDLYGILSATDPCSAGRWRDLCIGVIDGARHAGQVPIVVGGTGLYLRALLKGFHDIPAVPGVVRDRLMLALERDGPDVLHRRLAENDPQTAARISPGDRQRIVRALEVFDHTGKSLSNWQSGEPETAGRDLEFFTIGLRPPRQDLYAACDERFAWMIANGAVQEVRSLQEMGFAPDVPLMKSVGVPPICRFLEGEIGREAMETLGQRDTRRYAKRQTTWFSHQFVSKMTLEMKYSRKFDDKIFPEISNFLLTDR